MHKYIIRRLLQIIPVLIISTFLVFIIIELTPGSPARMMLGKNASDEAVEKLSKELGYDKPLLVRYTKYITNVLRGDFGKSFRTKRPVMKEILVRFPVTLRLACFCVIISIFIGLSIGIIGAVKQYTAADFFSTSLALILASVPDFWLGMVLILIFSLGLKMFPATGADSMVNYILPSFTLSAISIAMLIRMTRSTLLEVIRQDYIRTAKAKGANKKSIIFNHALRNAMLPIITVVGGDFAGLIGGTMLVETVFGMPGLGMLIIKSIRSKDVPLVLGTVIFLTIVGCLINLIVDISYAYLDPRIKSQYK